MKRIVTLLALLLAVCPLSRGQEIISITKSQKTIEAEVPQVGRIQYPLYEHMQYKDYSKLYDAGNYVPRQNDPFQPFVAGLASYFIPGLGQCVCGEGGRGLGFFLGTEMMGVGTIISILSTPGVIGVYDFDEQTVIPQPSAGDHFRNATLLAGTCALYVWNIFDAVKVAKIKNMYHHDVYGGPADYEPAEPVLKREVNPYMRYREYKSLYNPKSYTPQWGDPYSPVASGVASALFPGLGQCMAGEWGRGAMFMAGYILFASTYGSRADSLGYGSGDSSILALPVAAMAGLYIWNICDAVEVAKIKNLYVRDLRSQVSSIDLNLEPYFNCVPATTGNNQFVGGLALRMNF
jgi:hypothetical protein